MIRFAIVRHRVFQEPRKGFVARSMASRKLAEDARMQDLMGLTFEECWSGNSKVRKLPLLYQLL